MRRAVLFLIIIAGYFNLLGQRFTDIQAGLTGVSESASN
tara:strand:- start:112 stop:228 length:117 start_codon:yes stop_codon:yes gene_type:complete